MVQIPLADHGLTRGIAPATAVSPSAATEIDRFFVGLALKRAQHELRLAVNLELVALGTNISQVNVLREVAANPGVSSVQLATLTFLTPQSLGQHAGQLQQRGLLERRPGPGRTLRHYITEAGDQLYRDAIDRARVADEQVLEVFSDEELESLVATLSTIEKRAAEARAHRKKLFVVGPQHPDP
jgi:DNA-binding MarR family transcriptional regulator